MGEYKKVLEFSSQGYKKLLNTINKESYISCFFHEKLEGKSILLRHDIDVDLGAGVSMAKLEKEFNIKSTYFVMINSPLYNLFSRKNIDNINEILSLGHHLGLHYDAFLKQRGNLQESINEDINFLNKYFNIDIKVVSFHQPSKQIINGDISIKQINTYDKNYFSDIFYISDSNMQWKAKDPICLIKEKKYEKIQLLVHPIWWINDGCTTEEKWMESIIRNFNNEQEQLLQTERAYGANKELLWKIKR